MPVPLENAVALGRIGGPLLAENLVRKNTGVGEQNLAFHNVSDTDNILFLNVIDGKVGINNGNPQEALDVTGIIHSDDYLATTSASIAKFSVSTNRIINPFAGVNGKIIISPNQTLDPTILGPRFETVDLGIDDALIENLTLDSHINLNAIGTGQVYFTTSELLINGNLTVTGTTTWDGSLVTLGNSSDDNVIFNADINSHIIPNANDTWDLGSALQRWNTVYVKDLFADILYVSSSYIVSGVDVFLRQGNTIYVSVNGLDTNVGDHTHGTYRTIKHALSQATNGDTVVIFPGTYEEIFPLTVPQGVTVNGAGIRAVTVKPTAGTKTNNAFLLNGETTVSNLTVKDFYAPGNAFSFAANFTVSSRSPYIQNVSVITAELPAETASGITVGPSPTGISLTSNSVTLSKTFYSQTLVNSLVGQIAVIDRYPAAPLFYTVVSIETEPLSPTEWRMTVDSTFNAAGQLKPISFYPDVELTQIITTDIWDTTGNSVGEKWVAYYKTGLPEFFTTLVQPGWSINVAGTVYIVDYIIEDPVNTNMWRIYVTTSLVAGVGIPIFSSPVVIVEPLSAGNGALVNGSLANSASKEASMLFHSVTFIIPNADGITATNGARVEWLNSFTYFANRGIYLTQGTAGFANLGVKFGAELRSIGSANVYGTYGAVADGANTLAYLIGHNFAYIGTGTNSANDPSIVIQANEVLEINNGRIYYESADHKGDVRIGDIFYVNQETGVISFNAQALSFSPSGSISVEGGTSPSYIDKNMVISGNIKIYDNNIDSLSGPVNFLASSGSTYLNTNVLITGNTTVSSDINLDGNLYLGNQSTDSITVFSNLTQDLLPDDVGGPFTLGTDSNRWNTLFATLLNVDNVTQISSNTISTLTTNTNLILSAAGTGQVQVTNTDVTIANDLTVGNTLTVNGVGDFQNIEITGTITQTGDWDQIGSSNAYITGLFANTNIEITGSSYFAVPDIKLQNSEISATATDSDLTFTGATTGNVVLDQRLKINGSTISNVWSGPTTDTQRSVIFQPNGTGSVTITGTNAVKIPVGNTSTRTIAAGEIRYNDVTNLYEGGAGTGLISFNGLYDSDRNTYITAGAIDNTIYFGINNVVKTTLNSTSLNSDIFEAGNVRLTGNTLSNIVSGNDLTFAPNGNGNTVLNNLSISQNYIVNSLNTSLNLNTTGLGYVKFSGTNGLVVPAGNDGGRRGTPELGELRYNTQAAGVLEIYDGTQWMSAVGNNATVSEADVLDVLELWTLILG